MSFSVSNFFIDLSLLPNDIYGLFQLLFLTICYGFILMHASNMISDGSELLLLVPSVAGVVGSVVLPILGAVPDGMIVLYSGMGPNPQSELAVGVGALAGSTIMLLTVPWFLSIIGGRVTIDPVTRLPNYKLKLLPSTHSTTIMDSILRTGVIVKQPVRLAAMVMLCTAMIYAVLQIPALLLRSKPIGEQAYTEHPYASICAVLCFISFCIYLCMQYMSSAENSGVQELRRDQSIRDAIASRKITLVGFVSAELRATMAEKGVKQVTASLPPTGNVLTKYHPNEFSRLFPRTGNNYYNNVNKMISDEFLSRLHKLLKPFYTIYDDDKSGTLTIEELKIVCSDLGEHFTISDVSKVFKSFDAKGHINYNEFVEGIAEYILDHQNLLGSNGGGGATSYAKKGGSNPGDVCGINDDEDDEDDEVDDEASVPDDLAGLSPEKQQWRIKLRSIRMMSLGTFLVILFSSPMVSALMEISNRIGIAPFYVSFVLSPLISNASELIAAYNYSLKKTPSSITISLSVLIGAAIMNNTFVLGIFMWIMSSQHLAWTFFAETISILLIEVCMFYFACKRVHTILDAMAIISLYPLSLLVVWLLKSYGWD